MSFHGKGFSCLLRVFFCSVFFSVFLCFCFSLENDAFVVGIFEKKPRLFLKSVNIRRFCTGKRDVFCK